MDIRVLSPEEWRLWKSLRLRALADSPDAFGRTFEEESAFDDSVWIERLEGQSAIVAEDGEPVGIGSVRLKEDAPGRGQLFAMWVEPQARRRGAGRAIVDFALRTLEARGATSVELTVTEGNDAAMSLYQSFGFVDTGHREPLREGSPLRVVWMRVEL